MATSLPVLDLLKTSDKHIFIFDRNEKGEVLFVKNPQQFISYRSENYCSDVIDIIERNEKLICKIDDVLTQIDSNDICKIYKDKLPVDVMCLGKSNDGNIYSSMHKLNFDKFNISIDFLCSTFFFIRKSDFKKYLYKKVINKNI